MSLEICMYFWNHHHYLCHEHISLLLKILPLLFIIIIIPWLCVRSILSIKSTLLANFKYIKQYWLLLAPSCTVDFYHVFLSSITETCHVFIILFTIWWKTVWHNLQTTIEPGSNFLLVTQCVNMGKLLHLSELLFLPL